MGQLNLCATTREAVPAMEIQHNHRRTGTGSWGRMPGPPGCLVEQTEICHTPSPCPAHNWSLRQLALPPPIGSLACGLHSTGTDDHTIYTHLTSVLLQVFFARTHCCLSWWLYPPSAHRSPQLTMLSASSNLTTALNIQILSRPVLNATCYAKLHQPAGPHCFSPDLCVSGHIPSCLHEDSLQVCFDAGP